jgi:hypothetical protein
MPDRRREDLLRLVHVAAGIEHVVELGAVLGPLLDLVEIAVAREQRLISLLLIARNFYAKLNVFFAPFYSTTTRTSGLISFWRS